MAPDLTPDFAPDLAPDLAGFLGMRFVCDLDAVGIDRHHTPASPRPRVPAANAPTHASASTCSKPSAMASISPITKESSTAISSPPTSSSNLMAPPRSSTSASPDSSMPDLMSPAHPDRPDRRYDRLHEPRADLRTRRRHRHPRRHPRPRRHRLRTPPGRADKHFRRPSLPVQALCSGCKAHRHHTQAPSHPACRLHHHSQLLGLPPLPPLPHFVTSPKRLFQNKVAEQ